MNEFTTHLNWQSLSTWPSFTALACLTAAAFVFARMIRRASGSETTGATSGATSVWQDRRQLARRVSLGLSLAALALLAVAVLDVRRERRQSAEPGTVVVVVDESASVRRDGELRRRQLDEFSGQLTSALQPEHVPAQDGELTEAVRLVRFSGSAVAGRAVPLSQLSAQLFKTGSGRGGTDIAAALDRAAEAVEEANRQGAIVLCSDGNQTSGDALAAACRLAERGIAVHVFPVESPGPALFLHGVSAPPTVRADAKAIIRGLIRNSSTEDRRASLQYVYHHNKPGELTPFLTPVARPASSLFAAGSTSDLRQKLPFRGRGLHCVEVKLTPVDSNNGTRRARSHRVSLPVYVQGRPRILVIGNDTRWTNMINRKWEVVTSPPTSALAKLTTTGADFDAVVLSAVSAKRLNAGLMKELRQQVESAGTGLLVINGNHEQAGEKDPSVLMSYLKTELEPILPVNPGPRKHVDKPPARRVVITVDASGSMSLPAGNGTRMQAAHGICFRIIDKLRPIDTLEIIVFDDVTRVELSRTRMTASGKALARTAVQGIHANNGTNAYSTITTIGGLNLTDGALVMISDGDVSYGYEQKLRGVIGSKVFTMSFGAGMPHIPQTHPMYRFNDRKAIPDAHQIGPITFKPVESEKREKFFERKSFLPGLRLRNEKDREKGWLPAMALPGHAVSTLSSRPGTRMIGLHPDHSDPILVFGNAGRGRVGVLTAGIPEAWYENLPSQNANKQSATSTGKDEISKPALTPAQKAVSAWLEEVSAFSASDRYWMDASLDRERIDMRLVAFQDGDTPARLSGATITIRTDSQKSESFELRLDDRGVLSGSLTFQTPLPSGDVHLVIEEDGSRGEALTRPQRIPVLLPPDDSDSRSTTVSDEDWTQGVNRPLLHQIAAAGNGRMLDGNEPWPELLTVPERQSVTRFWQPLSTAGSLALVVAVFLSSVGRKW